MNELAKSVDEQSKADNEKLIELKQRLNYLQRLQTAGELDGEKWTRGLHDVEMNEIQKKINELEGDGQLNPDEEARLNELYKKPIAFDQPLSKKETEERDLLEKRKRKYLPKTYF